MQIAGPMWSAPIHDKTFVKEVLDFVNANADSFGTHTRMQGMLTVASEVRPNACLDRQVTNGNRFNN